MYYVFKLLQVGAKTLVSLMLVIMLLPPILTLMVCIFLLGGVYTLADYLDDKVKEKEDARRERSKKKTM